MCVVSGAINVAYFAALLVGSIVSLGALYAAMDSLKDTGGIGAVFGVLGVAIVLSVMYLLCALGLVLTILSIVWLVLAFRRKIYVVKLGAAIFFALLKLVVGMLTVRTLIEDATLWMIAPAVISFGAAAFDIACAVLLKKTKETAEEIPVLAAEGKENPQGPQEKE